MKHAALMVLAIAVLGHTPADVAAVESLSTAELASHCDHYRENPEGEDGIFCVRYIQGFIDGAVATDERVALNVAAEYEDDQESFTERAIRTRLGSRLERFGPSYYAEFCLGAPVPLAEVVERVVDSLAEAEFTPDDQRARDVVYQVLREHYPCEPDESAN